MTVYAHDTHAAPQSTTTAAPTGRWRCHAQLLGGIGDGRTVQLPELSSAIVVAVHEGQIVVMPEVEGVRRVAGETVYRLVEPVGPETPVYVCASWV